MDALVTAGGRGTRLGCIEKPMMDIDGRAAIDMVLDAVSDVLSVRDVFVSVSPNVPRTMEHLSARGVRTIDTSGHGYVIDLNACMHRMTSDEVLVVPADMPLIEAMEMERLVHEFRRRDCECLMLAYDVLTMDDALEPSFVLERDGSRLSYCGVSVVDRRAMASDRSLIEDVMLTTSLGCALNVNTRHGLELAREIARERAHRTL